MSPLRAFALGCLALAACGRDPAQVRWDADFEAALDRVSDDPAGAEATLLALAAKAPRAVDEGAARFEHARLVLAGGRTLEAANLLRGIAERSRRQDERARAYYQLARLAEDDGRVAHAKRLYRILVRTYPNLMPGERSLAHLLRIARAEGVAAVDRHLAWTRSLSEVFAHTTLADDLLFQAADEAKRRAELSDDPADWARTEALLKRLAEGPHTRTPALWNDAWWELSWLYHRQQRWSEEVAAIETIMRSREVLSLFGQDEHPYYWDGQLRIARLQLVELAAPARAADAFLRYVELFPRTIKKDDMLFFAGCAAARAGQAERAAALWERLAAEHADSRFLRRLEDARRDPAGPHCVPPEVTR